MYLDSFPPAVGLLVLAVTVMLGGSCTYNIVIRSLLILICFVWYWQKFVTMASGVYAKGVTSVCLSVCLSVMLVNCDHIVQHKVETGPWRDRSVSCLPICGSHSGTFYPVIPTVVGPCLVLSSHSTDVRRLSWPVWCSVWLACLLYI